VLVVYFHTGRSLQDDIRKSPGLCAEQFDSSEIKLNKSDYYKNFYDEHTEYAQLREQDNQFSFKYKNDVLHWKLKYLIEVAADLNPKNILEVGCAIGFMLDSLPFATPKENRVGIDISGKNILKAREIYPQINFFTGSLDEFIAQNTEIFDLIVLSDILEHLEDDCATLSRCSSVGRHILLNLPLEKCAEYQNRKYGIDDPEGHLRAYSAEDAFALIEKAGLTVVHYRLDRYVNQPVFRQYLLNKLLDKIDDKADALIQYEKELLHIELNQTHYKSNLFALLTHPRPLPASAQF
jgi:predicted TPR repeat methyltransferase